MKNKGLIFLSIFFLFGCNKVDDNLFTKYKLPSKSISHQILEVSHCGDSKFCNDYVITAKNNKLTFFDLDLNLVKEFDVNDAWQDVTFKDNKYYVISGNYQNEVIMTVINNDLSLISSEVIFRGNNLMIDPSILYFKDAFYVTYTEVEGTVNNSSLENENGYYSIKLYKTKDLKNYEFVQDIESEKANLEDIELFIHNDKIAALYEEETVNGSDSYIKVRYSDKSLFDKEVILVEKNDNEPAKIEKVKDKYYLYYSSDILNPGKTYEGSDMFTRIFDKNFNYLDEVMIPSFTSGIHLYDIEEKNDEYYFVSIINYHSTRDLMVEKFIL